VLSAASRDCAVATARRRIIKKVPDQLPATRHVPLISAPS
jgi:hypothetical protein